MNESTRANPPGSQEEPRPARRDTRTSTWAPLSTSPAPSHTPTPHRAAGRRHSFLEQTSVPARLRGAAGGFEPVGPPERGRFLVAPCLCEAPPAEDPVPWVLSPAAPSYVLLSPSRRRQEPAGQTMQPGLGHPAILSASPHPCTEPQHGGCRLGGLMVKKEKPKPDPCSSTKANKRPAFHCLAAHIPPAQLFPSILPSAGAPLALSLPAGR